MAVNIVHNACWHIHTLLVFSIVSEVYHLLHHLLSFIEGHRSITVNRSGLLNSCGTFICMHGCYQEEVMCESEKLLKTLSWKILIRHE